MIRFSAALVVVAVGVLIGGVATSTLLLVYVAIILSAAALIALAVGVARKRDELFGVTGRPVGDVMGAAAEQSALSRQHASQWRPGEDFPTRSMPGTGSSGVTVHGGPGPGPAGPASPPSPGSRVPAPPPPSAAPPPPLSHPAPARSAVTETRADLTAITDATGKAEEKAGSGSAETTAGPRAGTSSEDTRLDLSPVRSGETRTGTPAAKPSSGADDTRMDLPAARTQEKRAGSPSAAQETRLDMSPVVTGEIGPDKRLAGASASVGSAPKPSASAAAAAKPSASAAKSPAVKPSPSVAKSPAVKPSPSADDTRLDLPPVRTGEPADKQRSAADDTRLDLPAQPASPSAPAAAAAPAGPAPGAKAPEAKAPAAPQPAGDTQVAIIPGVPRYHAPNCILIRFMDEEDLEKTTLDEAKAAGCTPCTACQPTSGS